MRKIRVLLVDDHDTLRIGLRSLLSIHPDFEVVGETGDEVEAVRRVDELKPDVVVMDIAKSGARGLVATRQISQTHPTTKILVLTQYDDKEYIQPLTNVGAAGYVLKQKIDTDLIRNIRAIVRRFPNF